MQGRAHINKHTYCLDNGCAYWLCGVVHAQTT
nr:MAG TPA: LEF-12 protein-like protein [Caudoviricetes sp.]